MYKGSVGLCNPIIGRARNIWDKLFIKIGLSFDVMVISKKVSLDSSNCIDTHLDVFVEVLEFQSSVVFEFCLNEEFIEMF